MNEECKDKTAWLWYDLDSLEIRHVGFTAEGDHGIGLGRLQINFDLALQLVMGKQQLTAFELTAKPDSGHFMLQQRQIPTVKPKFWNLMDPSAASFNTRFTHDEDRDLPVRITEKDAEGFTVDVIKPAKNIYFYITMRNDPNYLIKTLELREVATGQGRVDGLRMQVGVGHDYSIYVRYDAS